MHYGRHFRLDTEVSHIERGVAIYRYLPDEAICLLFAPDHVSFFTSPHPNAQTDTNQEPRLLLLVYLDNEQMVVTLNNLMAWGTPPSRHGKKEPLDPTSLSYFSTFRFVAQKRGLKNLLHPRSDPSMPVENQQGVELFLHFLYDLQEDTRIFQMSPAHETFMERFNANFFARCLAAKARYCYQRAFYLAILKESNGAPRGNAVRAEHLRFYGEQYYKAEEAWTDCIRDPRSDKTFHESNGWFGSPDHEMRRVYRPWLPIILEAPLRVRKEKNETAASQWMVRRYTWVFPFWTAVFHRSFRGRHLLIPRLLFSIAAAWFTLLVLGSSISFCGGQYNDCYQKPHFIFLMCIGIVAASHITIGRVRPFSQNVLWRALALSLLVLMYACVLGCLLQQKCLGLKSAHEWVSAAFLGMVIQTVLSGHNPSDSV